ncbi:FKBP-type peptidyl-prolyl cis-trans isomerase N-terminal domain-containing protein [Mucilaginibacter ginsenosidivorax]|uniref:peptidylprolyl isomerase n=1 Tax=Mucilaginibacter ginsenosidivorax TaxID=862126 RepID=A0A5B8VX50_9SPHI|nr:FKBP-type peptidyl-prolyl cis-trans isomerase N-terminal domain-containing protein [Mucilaginibacter ginsenosidivorax]QEC75771.1 hypothetical protein FSB76_07320 [Mucilaginibacter ginsenosidivorax]
MVTKQLPLLVFLIFANLFTTLLTAEAQVKKARPQSVPDIYMAGVGNGNGEYYMASYFKNMKPGLPLTGADESTKESYGAAICVVGNDVYIAGCLGRKAVYWKNGQLVQLASTSVSYGAASAITVAGNDVYVGGTGYKKLFLHDGSKGRDQEQPRYWKNGQEVLLPQPLEDNGYENETTIVSMKVVGDDLYIIGRVAYGYGPIYWKNGQLVQSLNNGLDRVEKIEVVNGNVYAVGSKDSKAAYWKNGTTTILTSEESLATAIAVAGNDVYVTGIIGSYKMKGLYPGYGNGGVGKYWKNGRQMGLTGGADQYASPYPKSIAVSGNDVYIVGIDQSNSNYMLWKNGQYTALTNNNSRDGWFGPWAITAGAPGGVKGYNATVKTTPPKPQPAPARSSATTPPPTPAAPPAPAPPVQPSNATAIKVQQAARYLADNKLKPGVTTTASGLQYEILQPQAGIKPTLSDKVSYKFKRTMIVGNQVMRAEGLAGPVNLSMTFLAPGLGEGLKLMSPGSKYRFTIPPSLGADTQLRDRPADPNFPLGAVIMIFEVELLEILSK